MSDFYQLPNSTNDFKSRSNNVFDQLVSLEQQHDVKSKTQPSVTIADDESAASSSQNPSIPKNAIVFRKRTSDQEDFSRPESKWKKYDLKDVNEHHTGEAGNRRGLEDFLRTQTKPKQQEEEDGQEVSSVAPVFRRPLKKETITREDDDDDDQQVVNIRVPVVASSSTETKSKSSVEETDDSTVYRLKAVEKRTRGVLSTTKKTKTPIQKEKPTVAEEDDDEDDDGDDELFEP